MSWNLTWQRAEPSFFLSNFHDRFCVVSLSLLFFCVSANLAVAGITADWNSTSKTLTVTCTQNGQDGEVVQITKDGAGNVSVLKDGYTPITILDSGYPVSVAVGVVDNLIINGSSASDWFDCYHVTPANGWALMSSKLYGNGGGDDIDGTGIGDVIYGGFGTDSVEGNSGDDILLDFDVGESVSSCSAVDVTLTSGVLLVKSVGDESVDLDITDGAGSYVYVKLSGIDVSMGAWLTSSVDKLEIRGSDSSTGDTIDCSDVTTVNGFSGIEFVEIHGGAGADDITGTEFRDRIFGGPGVDDINGRAGLDYVIDYEKQGSTDSLTNCSGLNLIWKWDAGDITQSEYDSRLVTGTFSPLSGSPVDSVATTTSANSSFVLNASSSIPNTSLLIGNVMVVPRMVGASEKLEAHLRYYNSTNDQCQFRPRATGSSSGLDCGHYVFANKRYRWEITCEPSSDTDWDAIAWNVITQLHPGVLPASVNLYIRSDNPGTTTAEWGLLVRGDKNGGTPTQYDTPAFDRRLPFTPGDVVTISLEFTLDYQGQAGNAYTRVDIDDALLGETKTSNGLDYNPGGSCSHGSEQLNTGVYSNGALPADISKRPIVTYHSAYLYAE